MERVDAFTRNVHLRDYTLRISIVPGELSASLKLSARERVSLRGIEGVGKS